jgi:homoserine O-acetyltransferase
MNQGLNLYTDLFPPGCEFASAADIRAGRVTLIRDFAFASGETLPELLHYRTPKNRKKMPGQNDKCDPHHARHTERRAIYSLRVCRELFEKTSRSTRRNFSSCCRTELAVNRASQDGMHAKFPRYGYIDMVEADYRLLRRDSAITRDWSWERQWAECTHGSG